MAFQGDSIYWVEVEKIVANPFQPRREFDDSKLQELADSIRMYGILQPLTVTRREVQHEDGTFFTEYELIAGERRMRASKLAGVSQVPVIIREGEQSEQEKLELAIIENLQREDLNAVDRALAFKQLAEAFKLSHGEVAKKVGRSREYVSNTIRLLNLPEHILDALKHSDLTEGHARTLLMLSDRPEEQEVIFKEIVLKKLSVRESERIIRKIATDKVRKKKPEDFDAGLIELEKRFTETLGTRVQIQKTNFGGKLTIDYFSEEDLSTILGRIREEANAPQNQAAAAAALSAHTPLSIEDESQANTQEPESTSVSAEPTFEPDPQQPEAAPETAPRAVEEELVTQPHVSNEQAFTPKEPESAFPANIPVAEPTTPEPSAEPVAEEASKSPEQSKPSDESGLYSIRNFSI